MIRDLVRTACVVLVMVVAAALVVEVRERLAVLDMAVRMQPVTYGYAPQAAPEPRPLARFGRATLDLADAALGVVR
jgi:hypothetical protein